MRIETSLFSMDAYSFEYLPKPHLVGMLPHGPFISPLRYFLSLCLVCEIVSNLIDHIFCAVIKYNFFADFIIRPEIVGWASHEKSPACRNLEMTRFDLRDVAMQKCLEVSCNMKIGDNSIH